MMNFDNYVNRIASNENKTKRNKNWPYILNHPYRILIIGSLGSGKTKFSIKFDGKPTRH